MWRIWSMVVLGLISMLIFGAAIAYGSNWWWNSQFDVEGVDLRTVWTVDGGMVGGAANDYRALISVRVPNHASVQLLQVADNESIIISHFGGLECKDDGIEAEVVYRVSPLGAADGSELVEVTLTADGQYVDSEIGHLEEDITLQVFIPADDPACSADHD